MANFKGYIYKFTSTIDPIKCYIGKTFHIGSRLNNHLTGRGNTSSLQKALNLYGITCFTFEILYVREADTIEELNTVLNELEKYSIDKYDSFNSGYNDTKGGSGSLGYSPSDEIRELVSNKLRGHKVSEETRKKLSLSHRGFKHSEESINKMKIAFKNRSQEVELYRKRRLKEHLSSLTEEDIRMRANKCKKPIIQYSVEGEFMREWDSATDAASFYNTNKVNITKCCLGKNKTSIGYIWKYKEE